MNPQDDAMRKALVGLFDVKAEPEKIVVTAPGSLCDEFYRYVRKHPGRHGTMMLSEPMELGQEIHLFNTSTEQVVQWLQQFAGELDSSTVLECYTASHR